MAAKVLIPTPMRQHTDGKDVVEANGSTVKALLDDVGRQFPAITDRLLENGQVRRFVNVYLNDEDIRYLENLDTPVKDGDQVSIIPAVAGGVPTAPMMTLEEIMSQYDSEWVLVEDPELDDSLEVKQGRVVYHSKHRDEVYRKALELRPRRPALVFTGKVPAEGKVLVL